MLPIKDPNVLAKVQQCLLEDFKAGRRNYTIFQVGKATLLRVSDVLTLQWTDVFDEKGDVRQNRFLHDRKTAKVGDLLNLDYLGTHTMRKTGVYRVYIRSCTCLVIAAKL